jgi:RNA polymerase sigma-70 factor, ECF subfamily
MQAGSVLGNFANVIGAQAAARPEEAAVIAELQAGSEEAFASLIAQYHAPLYSLIARTIPDPCEAADITQDVFIKIYRGIGNFHGDSSLRTWIYRIALHEASNQRRWWCRHKRKEITIEQELSAEDGEAFHLKDTLVDQHESPFDMAAHAELREQVEAAVREVPEPFQTAIVLRDIEGFGYEEIAEILGVHLGTVKSRLMRGRAHLKARLAPLVRASAANSTASPDCSSSSQNDSSNVAYRAPLAALREAK